MTTSQPIDPKTFRDFEQAARYVLPRDRQDELGEFVVSLNRVLSDFSTGIADIKRLNDELRQSEARFRKIFNASYDAIFLVDVEREEILDFNEECCRMLGYSRDELTALKISDIHPNEMPKLRDFASQVSEHGRWQTHELTCRAKWGEFIPAELSATAIEFGGRSCMLVLAHDMREHRLAALGTAVAKINHDLRNILATAQLVSDRLARSADPEVQRITPTLIRAIDRAIALCTQTLTFGRAEELQPDRAVFALRELVDDVGASVGLPADGRITWRNEVEEGLEVNADRDQLFRVLFNLGRNAAQAIAGEGDIRISAARGEGTVVIEVADTGPGLSQAAREQLFQPFAGSARAGGTGLGLAIARDVMRTHGGDIALVKSDASGTVFRLELPDE